MGPPAYSPYPSRLESLTIADVRRHFLLSYFKTLSVGSAGCQTHDLPRDSPMLNQLSHGCAVISTNELIG